MKTSDELERQRGIFRARSEQISETVGRSPLTDVSNPREVLDSPTSESNKHSSGYIFSPSNNYKYDENRKEKFQLMNVKIVIYGLNGIMCEHVPSKKPKFGRKETLINESNKMKELNSTTAVVSCKKNGTDNKILFEKFLPSMPLGRPFAMSLNKVRYAASWPSEQLSLHQEEGAKERSSFEITRCMKQSAFAPGVGVGSNYCHETLEVGINISRGTELIRLGTALIVIDGEEEGEVVMNIPAIPFPSNNKKLKKRKNKYGYFLDDPSRRFFLENNSVMKIGVQVIPEEAIRFARKKEKEKMRKESELNELLEKDDFVVDLLQKVDDDNLERERIQINSLAPDSGATTNNGVVPNHKTRLNSSLPYFLCGSLPSTWVPDFMKSTTDTEPNMPEEIITDNSRDHMGLRSFISSVSESTDGSDDIVEVAGEL
eukprot:CAMPEP_0172367924 /NCGR_PEP_ID=MMETSP1060-20121228/24659_1 /TAXON_ID=37318 /ORGANISM="Pseudo-nitzschia pungens, Strain cf. cingulata" /LENGTH=429 /DNA_ID=CAMNT_0013092349 /DNA_START=88 /DNA_END=1377 /DNA_ORIENTATION=-